MYCENCGKEMADNFNFCPKCGHPNRAAEERCLSGIASPSMKSWRLPFFPCLGVYVTNRRIFVTRAPLKIQLMQNLPLLIAILFFLSGLVLFTINFPNPRAIRFYPIEFFGFLFLFAGIFASWYKDFSALSIQDLERRREYELQREQISRIELTDRGFWMPSKIVIVPKAGKKRSILFSENGSFKHALRVFQTFAPELCFYHQQP